FRQKSSYLVGTENELADHSLVSSQAHCKDPRCMPSQQRFDTAVEAFGTVVRQQQQPRHAPASTHARLLVHVAQPSCFGGELALCRFQAARELARREGAPELGSEGRSDLGLRYAQLAARPQRRGSRGQFAPEVSAFGVVLDGSGQAGCFHVRFFEYLLDG
ncbi:MAG: hypothetical protein ACE5F1_00225, partial [Planctomycetota bacterium]